MDKFIAYNELETYSNKDIPLKTYITGITCAGCGKIFSKQYKSFRYNQLCKACNQRNTFINNYGVSNPFQAQEIKDRIKESNLKKYGVEYYSQTQECRSKVESTCIERYGTTSPFKSEEVQTRIKETNLKKYGIANPFLSKEIQTRIKETNLKKYGVEYPMLDSNVKDKHKKTMLDRYGVGYYAQTEESHKHRKTRIEYNGMFFDSKPELDFYLHCIEEGKTIIRHPIKLEYEYDNAIHYYFPDFEVDGELIEIKGSYLLNKDTNKWYNPFDRSQDKKYEAKYDCAIRNRVRIIYV